jgi:hypothetical protein
MSNQELIPLKPLTKEEIISENLEAQELWVVKVHDEVYGPFKTIDLFNFSAEHPEICRQCEVKHPASDEWFHFYKVPAFQRRKPQLISTQAFVSNDHFYILLNGIKKGPYTHADLIKFLSEHEIMVTDQISVDGGNSWIKLYQHHQFDRRNRVTNKLPHAMKESLFIPKESYDDDIQDAIAGLVAEAKHEKDFKQTKSFDFNFSQSTSSSKKWLYPAVVMTFVFVAYNFYPKINNDSKDNVVTNENAINNDDRHDSSADRKPASVNNHHGSQDQQKPYPSPSRSARIKRLQEQNKNNAESNQDNYQVEETDVRNDYAETPEVDDRMPQDNYPPAEAAEAQPAEENREMASEERAEIEEIKEEMMDEIKEINNLDENQTPVEDY